MVTNLDLNICHQNIVTKIFGYIFLGTNHSYFENGMPKPFLIFNRHFRFDNINVEQRFLIV